MVTFCCADALIAHSAASRRLSQLLNFKSRSLLDRASIDCRVLSSHRPVLLNFPACTSYLKCAEARFFRTTPECPKSLIYSRPVGSPRGAIVSLARISFATSAKEGGEEA